MTKSLFQQKSSCQKVLGEAAGMGDAALGRIERGFDSSEISLAARVQINPPPPRLTRAWAASAFVLSRDCKRAALLSQLHFQQRLESLPGLARTHGTTRGRWRCSVNAEQSHSVHQVCVVSRGVRILFL